ncbi:L-fucose:H+ symporter permease [Flavilitoribacter nigricans]|uniref:L-fucose:H+ symporter permease n=1 Tax=Flavilitoribacter nigricans (strain ATCC 23147 / DSM 23189 / NBRC 102662 / NCIMB 1420 / SS-2) TaxID=1122177 RepID=A0A2D0N696_FLAN2|nr:L-fucose:H+ symporter permease [Flavilitoribacter nigricans]PHN04052.1 L-fucose:H+ symporter permease [Flavilitoribacter nigricans DSM 23189 = NBRC 102662]
MNSNAPVVAKDVLLPFILITSLFALWGFANAVTDPMVSAFKKVLELENFQASLVQLAFYGGYFTMALPAALFVRKYSYKLGVIVGLLLYAVGALLFYPAAVTQQFGFFLFGLYILTFGLAFLETTANPYILSMGDPSTATRRLNLAQSFNPMGLLGGLLVAQQFVLRKLQSDDVDFASLSESAKASIRQADLMVIRDPYVALGLVVLGVLVLIAVNKMPEKKDEGRSLGVWESIQGLVKNPKYIEGVIAQILYVGAQIMVWTYIYQYAEAIGIPNDVAGNYQFVAFILFFVGRFTCTFLLKYLNSGKLLMYLALAGAAFTAATIFIEGMTGLYALVGISFCMSLMFPTIYGIALDGLREEQTKIGAAGLVMAIVGGALMPTFQGMILDIGGAGYTDTTILGVSEVNFSFILPLICFLFIAWYGRKVYTVFTTTD